MTIKINVSNQIELRQAIFQVSNDFATDGVVAHDYAIHIVSPHGGVVVLTHLLPIIRGDGVHTISINGNGFTVDAANTGRVFLIDSGKVEIKNVVIANTPTRGNVGDGDAWMDDGFRVCADGTVAVNRGAIVSLSGVTVESADSMNGDDRRRTSHWGPNVWPDTQTSNPSHRDFAQVATAHGRI
ncbi:MAG: hypothetical protein ACRECX_03060 [Methyloceanibacter sp.]|uniref:hypothetical protein n=1 Tax=Methyloceanibacter sp. TaxID=1965321 RepID=UPI003D6CD047